MTLTNNRLRVESGLIKLHDLEEVILDCLETLRRRRTSLVAARRSSQSAAPCKSADARLIRRTAELINTAQQGQKQLSGLVIEMDLDPESDGLPAEEMLGKLADCRIRLQTYLLSLVGQARVFGEVSLEYGIDVLTRAQEEVPNTRFTERLRERATALFHSKHVSPPPRTGGTNG